MSTDGFDPSASRSGSAADAPDPMIGQVIDRYRITDKLGEGGMGEVYAAQHIHLPKRVALKLLRSEVLANEEAVLRFHQEANSAASIGSDYIIKIEDFGKLSDGRIFLAMELLQGQPLSDMIEHPQPPERLLDILIKTSHGLARAHQAKIVHRDMKPENIYVSRGANGEDIPKLLDFGIAKVSQTEGNNHLTRTGTIFGTPFYMAPEQALGHAVDHRADIYAMGVIMYEVFCGVVPFQGESFMGILTQHITSMPRPPREVAAEHGRVIPPGLDAVIMRAMKKEPAERFQTMDELVAALVGCYQQVVGPGMSAYMEAYQPPPRSATIAAPSPPPPGYPARGSVQTPMPITGQMQPLSRADQSQPHYLPQPGPPAVHAHQHPSAPYAIPPQPSDSMMVAPRKGKGGLIAVIVLTVLVVGGGGAAFYVLSQKDAETTDEVADNGTQDPNAGKAAVETDPGRDPEPVAALDAGAGKAVAAPNDAATQVAVEPKVAPDAAVQGITEPEQLSAVLVDSKPDGAKVYIDGRLIGQTPTLIKVRAGEPVVAVLKKSGRKDSKVVIDGKTEKVVGVLRKVGGGRDDDEPTGDPDTKPPEDPCKKNPHLAECMLE